jgi:methylated-DNA-[protein]-cysteine S-methyltransferase
VTAGPEGIVQVNLLPHDTEQKPSHTADSASAAHLHGAEAALRAYFGGDPDALRHLTVTPEGTPFQRSVWSALRTIPAGTTISYRELAVRVGKPDAVRAVGLANGRNPIPIIVPCHRVIGADRSLTGFGLGIPVKAWLLVHEGAAAPFADTVTAATRVVPRATLWSQGAD